MKIVGIMILVVGLFVGAIGTASAQGSSESNPSALCAENTIMVEIEPGFIIPLEIPSHGGCVSTVASRGLVVSGGDYSHAAFVAQCKLLKSELPAELWNAPVDIIDNNGVPENIGGFGGSVETCTWLLEGYHSGTLTHPE